MAFIPIDAKADIQGSKKGKLTPSQHAQLNAWCLADKTGILDCLGRCKSTYNSYSVVGGEATVVFQSGYIVICGRLVECEAGTTLKVTAPATATPNTGKIVARFNLAGVEGEEFKVLANPDSEPLIQEDLNEKSVDGVYNLVLYNYSINNVAIELTRNEVYVPDIGGKLDQFEKSLKDEGKPLGGYDESKGTIEERLTKLGFKEGRVTEWSTVVSTEQGVNNIKRQGNYCILNWWVHFKDDRDTSNMNFGMGTVPDEFLPLKKYEFFAQIDCLSSNGNVIDSGFCVGVIKENGDIFVKHFDYSDTYYVSRVNILNIGYEAKPIEKKEGE